MMANKEMEKLLDDIMIEHITSAPISELITEYDLTTNEIKITQARFHDRIHECKQKFKKAKLKNARTQLETEKKKHEEVDVVGYLTKKGKGARDILVELFIQQKLPENLTVAHREGKEITDEDAKQILANLIAMGAINIDD
ncbi:hypothetical protein [Marinomonas transparens]|uniref:Uncharacterized protein n=1 Tax=Marinomonas transparens TaxID=2795388 RepID=A0A934JSI0_9GAMM|nr:hypothetical protein [Marinomonas transparens]MBJ7539923.1 hypothetical protein [Marinomonas transparens]